ncbi:MAG: hypothetical protein EB059_08625, partial [Alphaproteobacteria bacterium]|nr:hypothetical protein [Alphaproteobacteria bacterium]
MLDVLDIPTANFEFINVFAIEPINVLLIEFVVFKYISPFIAEFIYKFDAVFNPIILFLVIPDESINF